MLNSILTSKPAILRLINLPPDYLYVTMPGIHASNYIPLHYPAAYDCWCMSSFQHLTQEKH